MTSTLSDVPPGARPGLFRRLFRFVNTSRLVALNLIFLLLVVLLLAALVGWFVNRGAPKLQDNTALVLKLDGSLVEQRSGSVRDRIRNRASGQTDGQVQLRDLMAVLDAAAKDPKISRAVLLLDDFKGAGMAQLREAAAAIDRFKASGKPVIAWGAHYDQKRYYLAAHASEVLLHPMGAAYADGFGRLRNYYRDAFDRLGVSANVIRVGKYKNFGEPFFANAPSKATLESDAYLYDALWAGWTGDVERARKLPAGSVAKLIDGLPQNLAAVDGDMARLALDAKWVDALQTRDQLRDRLVKEGVEDKEHNTFVQVGFDEYLQRIKPPAGGAAVGVIVAQGEISDGEAGPGAIGGRSTAELVRKARHDEDIKAIVLRVDSPGGSAFGSELVRRELELARAAGKPVVVSMGNVAASGGYWISMASDEVIAEPNTITGSIGVFGILPTAEGLMKKLSINTAGYTTTWLGQAYDPRKPLDPRLADVVQLAIGRIYQDFIGRAAEARKTTPDKIDAVAQGRVWTGAQALERGLVDRVGSYGDALQAAATRAKLADGAYAVRYVEPDRKPFERLLESISGAAVQALGPQLAQNWLPLGAPPALARDMQRELLWLSELSEGRQPFAGVVHCLCGPP
ncbi:signal peptide peptidase SppA [Rivibacter subsaxonicus]|uniref:Protease-4 n=1 Tax=Rivibacter subsaxonicus TaxID=457575 RepID=A0A4Q7W1S2_9BURK|nr:signal peptide peptidase SppA [Rivibacter subsaxonicus]RZU02993.1 protease-4 [Rivibacter subsaxonicus]